MYGGGSEMPEQAAGPEESAEPKKEEKSEGKTFMLNKDIDPSFKVGEEMVVKIVAVHEKEYEVEYAPEPAKEGEGEAKPEGEMGMGESNPGEGGGGGNPMY